MSWSGFKKNVGRATTQVMMKTGHVEKTSDREYEVEERRYRTLESASLRLQKEAKGYLDSLRAMTASQMRIAETIDAFYGEAGAKDGVSRSYKQAVEDLDAETVKALDGPYRYVTLDPEIQNLASSVVENKKERDTILQEIEAELNWKAGNRKDYTRDFTPRDIESASQLIECVYRTTVLEPISRFCAYFPDINECIKKRNHKMLDYDAMRSKVKKLTEKPDKDPSKLPRAEKETEMVNTTNLLSPRRDSPIRNVFRSVSTRNKDDYKYKVKYPAPVNDHEDAAFQGVGLNRASSTINRFGDAQHGAQSTTDAVSRSHTSVWKKFRSSPLRQSSTDEARGGQHPSIASIGATSSASTTNKLNAEGLGRSPDTTGGSSSPRRHTVSDSGFNRSNVKHKHRSTPFFNPSELESIMSPLKVDFIKRQTNLAVQAKAVYDQLNEQLTTELPQLIDLRVPYLDPSFEALVKIQLRFCAEAYSRMAQVQQYLDASTRDQYASGDLDARVEDVLGQIRELSIAGTV